ncbi:hypothetical protein WA158_008480 [Blastocystis sp. Blastoise]
MNSSSEAKIVVVGAIEVGKTSISNRYVRNEFVSETNATIGASYLMKNVTIGDNSVLLKLWDTAGQERFKTMGSLYFRQINSVILVFDLSSPTSLEAIPGWYNEVKKYNLGSTYSIFLVGNKSDLQQKVSDEAIKEISKSIGAKYFTTSAKNGQGIDELFVNVAMSVIRNISPNTNSSIPKPPPSSMNSNTNNQSNEEQRESKACCCSIY